MPLLRINKNPTRRQLLTFGLAWFIFVGAWGLVAWLKANLSVAIVLWALATVIPLIGQIFPKGMRLLYLGLSYATFPIGFVVSHLLLGGLYFLVFTPIALIMRIVRYDPLTRRFDPNATTYWQPRNHPRTATSYFRQN